MEFGGLNSYRASRICFHFIIVMLSSPTSFLVHTNSNFDENLVAHITLKAKSSGYFPFLFI